MSEHDLEKLLGGFAADTLTPEERKLLYTAALQDQQLFNALADEQALKELLADPVVRRRLLETLQQTSPSGTGGSLSWLDWFRRPPGLAFAGGLAAAALAVVLGTKIYQDSLKQAVHSVATDEAQPAVPPVSTPSASQPVPPQFAEPQSKAKQNVAPSIDLAKKDALADTMVKREQSTPSKPQEQRASDAARDRAVQQSEQDKARRQLEAPAASLSKTAEEVSTSADQKLAASAPPSATAPAPAPMQAPAGGPIGGTIAPAVSARALFYGGEASRPDSGRMAAEKERVMKPLAESASQAMRPERKMDQFALAGKAVGTAAQLKPLGLRYSLIMAGPGGIDMEVDPTTAVGKDDAPRLAIQANEDGYLTVVVQHSPDAPMMLFPSTGDGHVPRLTNIAIALASLFAEQSAAEQVSLLVLFSRTPHDVGKTVPFVKKGRPVLIERIDPGQPGAPAEQAVYVVDLDPAPAASVSVEIPLSLRP